MTSLVFLCPRILTQLSADREGGRLVLLGSALCHTLDWMGLPQVSCFVLFCWWEEVRQEFRGREIIQNPQRRTPSRTWPHGAWNHSLTIPEGLGRAFPSFSSGAPFLQNSTPLSICSPCIAYRVSFCSHSLPLILTLTTDRSVFKTQSCCSYVTGLLRGSCLP